MSATIRARSRRTGGACAMRSPCPPSRSWLDQVHGARSRCFRSRSTGSADAAVAFEPGPVAAVLTADCLPVFLASRGGDRVGRPRGLARARAGRDRGDGCRARDRSADLLAWLGPAIGPAAFEVGGEVRRHVRRDAAGVGRRFPAGQGAEYLADLPGLARRRLAACGVTAVHGGGLLHGRRSARASFPTGATARPGAWPR